MVCATVCVGTAKKEGQGEELLQRIVTTIYDKCRSGCSLIPGFPDFSPLLLEMSTSNTESQTMLFHAIRRRGQWDEGIFGCNQFAQRKVQQRWCENGCRNSCARRPRWTIPPNFRSWSDRKWKLERWALGNAWLVAASEHSAETMVNRMPIADVTYQINFVFCKVNSANVTVSGQSFKSIRNCLF